MLERKLRATWSTEAARDLYAKYSYLHTHVGVSFEYVAVVRWWQFWRWRLVLTDDYVLSRADELVGAQKIGAEVMRSITEGGHDA